MMVPAPPWIADATLRLLLSPRDRETVSGDLVEEYRRSILPSRGRRRADLWFWLQVGGYLWRQNGLFAVLLAASFVTRTALDWLLPTSHFEPRANISTSVGAAILLSAGLVATWRSHTALAGALAGFSTALFSAVLSAIGAASLLLIYHDADTIVAIQGSGGLGEVFTLPLILLVPGTCLGIVGGLCAGGVRRVVRKPIDQ